MFRGRQFAHCLGRGMQQWRIERWCSSSRRQCSQHLVWIEVEEPRVALDESTDERPARQKAVVAFLERPYLARCELQLLGDGVDRKSRCLARGNEEGAGCRARRKASSRYDIQLRRGHSQSPVVTALASAESG